MGRKPKVIKIRCSEETKAKWARVAAAIDHEADNEEILDTMMDAYEEQPDLFERVHEFGRAIGDY